MILRLTDCLNRYIVRIDMCRLTTHNDSQRYIQLRQVFQVKRSVSHLEKAGELLVFALLQPQFLERVRLILAELGEDFFELFALQRREL